MHRNNLVYFGFDLLGCYITTHFERIKRREREKKKGLKEKLLIYKYLHFVYILDPRILKVNEKDLTVSEKRGIAGDIRIISNNSSSVSRGTIFSTDFLYLVPSSIALPSSK